MSETAPAGEDVLVDTSVWSLVARHASVVDSLSAKVASGARLRTCPIVDLELLHSARGPAEYDEWADTRARAYPSIELLPDAGRRALEVQRELCHRGLHRVAKLPDLLIAALAEISGATVLHYDADFDSIGEVTGQTTEWIVPRGSID